ncbi:MAG: cytochrome b561 domain-containing protein [Paracoccaceae bacterium]
MWEWLLSPIDPSRAHEVGFAISWHGRAMVIGWGVLAPLAIIITRFFKITPQQNWPQELDSKFWWRTHWMGQTTVVILSLIGIALVLPPAWGEMSTHHILGYGVLAGMVLQVALGLTRGSKGGPTDRSLRGHHYDMTPWRCMFEALHKTIGYITLALAAVTILFGLWHANAPVWMWGMLALWWPLLAMVFVSLQKRGLAVDTYQAIWGDDPAHPGNARPAPGWGVRRPGDDWTKGDAHVRRDRGDRLRSH